MKTIFKASLDTTAKVITIGILLLFLGLGLGSQYMNDSGNGGLIAALLLLVLIFGFSYLYSTKSYELDENELTIHRPVGKIKIPRSEIKSVLKLEKGNLRFTIRKFGVGGLFGYFGKFWNKELGDMTWYATRMDQALLIITNENKKLLITPNESDLLIDQLNLSQTE